MLGFAILKLNLISCFTAWLLVQITTNIIQSYDSVNQFSVNQFSEKCRICGEQISKKLSHEHLT